MPTSLPLTRLSPAPHPCLGWLVPHSPGTRLGWGCLALEEVRQGWAAGPPHQLAFPLQIRWEKNITLGEPPGFLHSWWWCVWGWWGVWRGTGWGCLGKPSSPPPAAHSVFWDLYCAAPDRREACEHSNEAKAFQDYVSPCPMDLDQGSWAWASFRAWGLGGLHGLRLAGVGRWVWCWGLIWDVGHFRGFPMPSV